MATQLDIETQINQMLVERNKFLESSTKMLKDQVAFSQSIAAALKNANYRGVAQDIEETSEAVTKASESTKTYGSTNQDVFDKVNASLKEALSKEEAAGKGMDNLATKVKKFAVAASAIDGFAQGLKFTNNMIHTMVSTGAGLVQSLGHLGAAIISIPFKMLSGLIHMSDQGGGSNELRQALEDIRKEFGSLSETSGHAVVQMARSMKGELSETGLRVTKIFGNLAERLKTMQEYAHNLGPLFAALAPQFVKNAEAIGAYYKGLGLTEEGQKAVATRAFALQKSLTDELREITNYSQQLSKAFDGAAGSAKEISREMGTLMFDFKHFGGISTKEIGQAVVYFRRLGIEVSKVMGVIEKYDNFEDAANGAAQLSQAFNLNVDALQMMKAQNPAERVEMLRKSFFAAGRSVENMTRQERALLAQQTGLDDSALDLAFSMKNQGMSYDQVTKKADAAKKSQMTQTQAMKALADSIERLVKSGGSSGSGGFIDRFIQGFTVGIQRSHDFRKIMRELRIDLRTAYFEGIKVGKAFVAMFPGVKDVFKGIADLFEPRRFRAMFHGVTATFKTFFQDMSSNPKTALPKLLDNLKKNFFSWFQDNSQNGQKILDGFKKFFIALSDIAGSLLKVAIDGLKNGIRFITDLLTGKRTLDTGGTGKGAQGLVGRLFSPILDAIKESGPALWVAIKDMFSVVWTKVQPWLQNNFLKILGVLAGPSLIGIAGKTIATSIASMFAQGLFGFLKGGGIGKAFDSVKGLFNKQVETVSKAVMSAPKGTGGGAGGAVAGSIKGAEEAAQAASGSKVNWGKALVQMAAITLFVVVGMVGIMYAIFRFAKAMQEHKLTVASVLSASFAMVATATAMLGVAGAVKLLSSINLNAGMAARILVGLAIVGGVGALMAIGALALIEAFGNIEMSRVTKTVAVMAGIGTFFLAASGVVAIAGLVGAMALAGGGLGALAITAGMGAIAATVEIMVTQGMRVMRAIDQFHPGPGFVQKANVFVDVMKGIGEFALTVSKLVEATRPGIVDFLSGVGGSEQRKTLAAVNETIRTLGGQIVTIVETLSGSIQKLSGSEAQLRGAQSLGTLLGAVAELGNALKPPAEAMQESGWVAVITGQGESVANRVQAVQQFVMSIGWQLRQFVGTIANLMTGTFASGISPEQQRAAEAIPTMLKGVADFARSLQAGSNTILQLANTGHQESVLNAVSGYMSVLLKNITESQLFTKISDVLTSIASAVGGLNPAQVRAVEAVAPIVGPAFSAMAQIANIISSLAVPSQGPVEGNAGAIYQLIQLTNTFFDRIKNDLPNMVTSMRAAFDGMTVSDAERLSKGMEGVTKMFQVLAGIPQMLQSIKGMAGRQAVDAGSTSAADLDHTFNLLELALGWSVGSKGAGFVHILKQAIPAFTDITNAIPNAADFGAKIGSVKTIFDVMGSLPGMLKSLNEIAGGAKDSGQAINSDVLMIPLTSLNNVLQSLANPSLGGIPNPLVGGRLQKMLAGVTGISDRQKGMLVGTVDKILEVSRSLLALSGSSIPDNSTTIIEGITHLNSSVYAFATQLTPEDGTFMSNITAIRPLVERLTSEIQRTQFEKVAKIVTGMVSHVNQLSATIRGIQPIEIEQSLQKLGDTLGLGSDGEYTIQNRNFTINLTVAVRLDNNGLDALELAMLRRVGPHPTRITHGSLER